MTSSAESMTPGADATPRVSAAITGLRVGLDRLYWIITPLKLQVGEMAPLKTKSVALEIVPCCARDTTPPETFSSYQSTRERVEGLVSAPTVCCVYIPSTGSPTACVSRASRVSIGNAPPGFGAELGTV